MKSFVISAFLLLALGAELVLSPKLVASDTVNPVPVNKIRLSPDDYDGKRVKVSGQVRSITSDRGRRGSEFLTIVIEGTKTNLEETSETLKVFIYFAPPIKKGSSVIVFGTYHKSGHWGGTEQQHFIEASKINPVEIN
ncbi:MAG: hypothetical protein HY200_01785 [Nitrospirae bacterium]|nr:hypothetical protein [Nitrospirota bacterium]MBI3593667.1 hypothetical protein [Nitrospirota bacterium]